MKIALAQTYSVAGDIDKNIEQHISLILAAAQQGVEVIIFPELSITGYEPGLAAKLGTTTKDPKFQVFQELSDTHKLIIGIGLPLKQSDGIRIGLLLFHPNQDVQVYAKNYLHPDELPFFTSGNNTSVLINGTNIGLAICYELSVAEHIKEIKEAQAEVFIASVAKHEKGIQQSYKILSNIAKDYCIPVILVNCVGPADNFIAAGQSAIWNKNGLLVEKLSNQEKGLLILEI